MRGTAIGLLLACVGVAMLSGCRGDTRPRAAAAPPAQALPIRGGDHGQDPTFQEMGVRLISSEDQLDQLGNTRLQGLGVDFNGESLVLLTLGEQPTGGYWGRITGVERRGNELIVHGLANQPGPDQTVTQALSYPYDAVVIPRVPSDLLVRSEIESVTGMPDQQVDATADRSVGEPLPTEPAENPMAWPEEPMDTAEPAEPREPTVAPVEPPPATEGMEEPMEGGVDVEVEVPEQEPAEPTIDLLPEEPEK